MGQSNPTIACPALQGSLCPLFTEGYQFATDLLCCQTRPFKWVLLVRNIEPSMTSLSDGRKAIELRGPLKGQFQNGAQLHVFVIGPQLSSTHCKGFVVRDVFFEDRISRTQSAVVESFEDETVMLV